MTYEQILQDQVAGIQAANKSVQDGRSAAAELSVTEAFVIERTGQMVKALLDCDPSDFEAVQALIIGLKAMRALHDHLAQKVAEGNAAVMRLQEQSKGQ